MGGGAPKKVEAAKRRGQNWNEERSKFLGALCSIDRLGVQRTGKWEDTKESAKSSLRQSTDWGRMKWRSSSTDRPRKPASSEDRKHTSGGVFVAVARMGGAQAWVTRSEHSESPPPRAAFVGSLISVPDGCLLTDEHSSGGISSSVKRQATVASGRTRGVRRRTQGVLLRRSLLRSFSQ